MLKKGSKAPAFKGIDQHGNTVELKQFKGKKLILYFYPKDSTPGCTAEACSLRDASDELDENGYAVVGVSADSQKSHLNFATKQQLNFPLIADTDHKILEAYEAWGEKSLYGRKYMGILRKTFVINEKGNIERIIEKVNTKSHAQQILEEEA